MFEKLVKQALEMGLYAQESKTFAGQYCDGEDHGEYFPVALIDADYEDYHMLPKLEKMISRRGLVYDWRSVYGGRRYVVWIPEDRERARALDNVARAFLDAFWMAIHLDNSARDNDSAGAIAAGRAAVAEFEMEG